MCILAMCLGLKVEFVWIFKGKYLTIYLINFIEILCTCSLDIKVYTSKDHKSKVTDSLILEAFKVFARGY